MLPFTVFPFITRSMRAKVIDSKILAPFIFILCPLLAKVVKVSLSISPRYKTLVPTTSRRGDGCEGLDLVVGW